MSYRKFKIAKKVYSSLSQEDKKIVKILGDVVKDTSKLYQLQLKDGFYPSNITKQQIEEFAKRKPAILSPFTFIKKRNKEIEAIPFYRKYSNLLQPIAEKINKAAKISSNKSFSHYLKLRAQSLLDGSYKKADIAWLDVKNSKIDFSIGPFERYLDKLLFIKRVYQAHVGIIDDEMTDRAEQIKEVLYTAAKLSFDRSHSTDIPKKGVRVFVEFTPATAGYMADVVFSGEHFPSDLEIMKQYGSRILIYRSQMKLKFERLHYPIFKLIFEKRFAAKYSKELLFKATAWNILLYELGRQLHKFIGARERLQELYGFIDEANGAASGIQHAKSLVIKGLISQEELEAIIIINIVWMFADWLLYQQNKAIENYVLADAVALNTYLSHGALREKEGIYWPNFSKIFFEIEDLANILVNLLHKGTYGEVSDFLRQNSDLRNFVRLSKNLERLKFAI